MYGYTEMISYNEDVECSHCGVVIPAGTRTAILTASMVHTKKRQFRCVDALSCVVRWGEQDTVRERVLTIIQKGETNDV